MNSSAFNGAASFAEGLLKRPAQVVENQDNKMVSSSLSMMKSLHDVLIADSSKFKIKNEHLVVANMNDDQIWEQLTIHLGVLDKAFDKYITSLPEEIEDETEQQQPQKKQAASKKQKKNQEQTDEDEESDQDASGEEIDLESEYEDDSEEVELNKQKKKPSAQKKQKKQKDENEMEQEEEEDGDEEEEEDDDEEGDENDLFGKNDQKEDYEEKLDFAEMNAFLDKQDAEEIERDSEVEDELGSDYEMDDGDSDKGEGEDGFKFKNDLVDDYEPSEEDVDAEDSGDEKLREADYDAEDEIFDLEREHELQQETKKENVVLEKVKNEDEIDRLEERLIGDKEWLLKGEINSRSRPINSLVEKDVDFRKNIKVQQEIDEKYNKSLEALIKQRIVDDAYDDRVRVNFEQAYKETFANSAEISKEKSKLGLGDLYEQDFKNSLGLPSTNKEDKLKLEIHNLFKEVCYKLDALSNLSFTPKPVLQKPVITTNVPSLTHESRIPIAVSQADTQRPEEVFNKKKEVVHASSAEMTHDDKQAVRRQKKSAARQRNKEKEAKKLVKNLEYNGQTKNEYNQIKKAQANGKKLMEGKRQQSVEFTKSSEFFKNMQNAQQSDAAGGNKKFPAANKTKPISKKYK